MTVLVHDAVGFLSDPACLPYQEGSIADVVYADDTLLLGTSDAHVNEFVSAVASAGARRGMELLGQIPADPGKLRSRGANTRGRQNRCKGGHAVPWNSADHDGTEELAWQNQTSSL